MERLENRFSEAGSQDFAAPFMKDVEFRCVLKCLKKQAPPGVRIEIYMAYAAAAAAGLLDNRINICGKNFHKHTRTRFQFPLPNHEAAEAARFLRRFMPDLA